MGKLLQKSSPYVCTYVLTWGIAYVLPTSIKVDLSPLSPLDHYQCGILCKTPLVWLCYWSKGEKVNWGKRREWTRKGNKRYEVKPFVSAYVEYPHSEDNLYSPYVLSDGWVNWREKKEIALGFEDSVGRGRFDRSFPQLMFWPATQCLI